MKYDSDDYKEDLRVLRTRKLLSEALIELLQTRSFEELSVSDICDKALVRRATFYNHFEDKNHLLEYCLGEFEEQVFKKTASQKKYASAKEMYLALISGVIDFIEENKVRINKIMEHNSLDKVKILINNSLITGARYLISKNEKDIEYVLPERIVVDFVVGGLTNVGFSWLISKRQETKEELLNYADVLLNENVYVKKPSPVQQP